MNEEEREQTIEPDAEPYEAPAIVESARFETIAAACNYAAGQSFSCDIDNSGIT